jgi:DNA-binding GntR family transcriptional regulator
MIARKTLHDELFPLLCNMIVEGELDPGFRIPEKVLCARFGVSRTPLREVLKMLSVKGLVHLLPNRGASVVCITQQEAEELIPLLGTIESHASELACARIDTARISHVKKLHGQLLENHRAGSEQGYLRTNRAIHNAIVAAAGNHILSEIHQLVDMRLCLLPVTRKLAPQWNEAIDDHEGILTALYRRDGAHLATIMRDHVRHKAIVTRRAFESHGLPGQPTRRAAQ